MKHTELRRVFLANKHQSLDSMQYKFRCCDRILSKLPSSETMHAFVMQYLKLQNKAHFLKILNEDDIPFSQLDEWLVLKDVLPPALTHFTDFLFRNGSTLVFLIDEYFLINVNLMYSFLEVCNKVRTKFNRDVRFLFFVVGSETQCISIGAQSRNMKSFLNKRFGERLKKYYLSDVQRTDEEQTKTLIEFVEKDSHGEEEKYTKINDFFINNNLKCEKIITLFVSCIEDYQCKEPVFCIPLSLIHI